MGLWICTPVELLSQIFSTIVLHAMPKLLQSREKDKFGPLFLASRWWITGREIAESYLLVEFLGKESQACKIYLLLQGISCTGRIKTGEVTYIPDGCQSLNAVAYVMIFLSLTLFYINKYKCLRKTKPAYSTRNKYDKSTWLFK